MWLFFCYTIQILTQVVAEKLTEKSLYILYKSERRKYEKRRQNED